MISNNSSLTVPKRNLFEYWLMDMDDAIASLFAMLPEDVRNRLNYSMNSLDVIEDWILRRYPNQESALAVSEASVVDSTARYIGETFRKLAGGHWDINLDNPTFVYTNLPILVDFDNDPSPECPISLVTAAIDRRTNTYIRNILEYILQPK